MDNKFSFKPVNTKPAGSLILSEAGYDPSVQVTAAQQKHSGWIDRIINTSVGPVPVVKTKLNWKDRFGGYKVRWGWNRMDYLVKPGIYAIGSPDSESMVLVTANYKLTFDSLRRELAGMNVWILVLDTKGVNVWCAAGKGTFGTKELIHRIQLVNLAALVSHKKLLLPQLGAVGVEAHKVTAAVKFHLQYGPVYARDIKKYIELNFTKTEAMKKVCFTFYDRLVLIPIELTSSTLYIAIAGLAGAGLSLLKTRHLGSETFLEALVYIGAIITGAVAFPLLLPWLPGRAFSIKGAIIGIAWAFTGSLLLSSSLIGTIGNLLLLAPITAYLALNFTGATTFTSQAGTLRETKASLPVMALSAFAGLVINVMNSVTQFIKAGV